MMSIESRIEKEIQKKGGRLILEEEDEDTREFFSLQLERFKSAANNISNQLKSIKYIEVDLIDNHAFGAFAKGQNGKYFIGIYRGTLETISLIFTRLFADKEFLAFVGDISVEENDLPLIENLLPNFQATIEYLLPFDPPKDPARKEQARLFSWLGFDLILAHELGHIMRGHADLYEAKGNLHLDETEIAKANKAFRLERKTLEMDADIWACNMLLTTEFLRCLGRLGIPGEQWRWTYERPGAVLLNFSLIVSTIFKIFGDKRLDNKPFEEQTYPVPRLRFVISKLHLANHLGFKAINSKTKFDLDEDGVPIHAELAFNLVEKAFKTITGKNNDDISATDARGELGINQLNILRKHWNDILVEKLKPFTHIELEKMNLIK